MTTVAGHSETGSKHRKLDRVRVERWTFVGDVGAWNGFHVGDEAMMEANLELFRDIAPHAGLNVVSADPGFSATAYNVAAVARLGFDACVNDEEREALLARLDLADGDHVPEAFARLQGNGDGLVISGGGNLTSPWPNCIYERLAFCRRAARAGAPIVFLGQTFGPKLEPHHRRVLAEMLELASWVGVREEHSFALALDLGASRSRLSYQLDDAALLGADRAPPAMAFHVQDPWIAVTFHPMVDPTGQDPLLDALARELDTVAEHAGCPLVFIPHAKAAPALGAPWSDEDVGNAIARRMQRGVLHVLPVMMSRDVASLTRAAAMVISSRYHPIVFALSAGVPCVAIPTDRYTGVKLRGALAHYERTGDACDFADVHDGGLADMAIRRWTRRAEVRRLIEAQGAVVAADEQIRKQQLRAWVTGEEAVTITPPRRLAMALAVANTGLDGALNAAEAKAEDIASSLQAVSASMEEATAYAASLDRARKDAEAYAASLETKIKELEEMKIERESGAMGGSAVLSRKNFELDDAREENHRLRAAVAQSQSEVLALSKTLAALRSTAIWERDTARAEVQKMASALDAVGHRQEAESQHLRDHIAALTQHIAAQSQHIDALYASSSWRLTGPLRRLRRLFA